MKWREHILKEIFTSSSWKAKTLENITDKIYLTQ